MKSVVLIETYINELSIRILLNIVSIGLSLLFLFYNREFLNLLILTLIFKYQYTMLFSTETLVVFPYFEYTTFSNIYEFYVWICINFCSIAYLPSIIWQIHLVFINGTRNYLFPKTKRFYYFSIYLIGIYIFNFGFISTYQHCLGYFQLLFSTYSNTNPLGLTIDYIPTLSHIQNWYATYWTQICKFWGILAFLYVYIWRKNKYFDTTISSSSTDINIITRYSLFIKFISKIKLYLLVSAIFLIILISPPDIFLQIFVGSYLILIIELILVFFHLCVTIFLCKRNNNKSA